MLWGLGIDICKQGESIGAFRNSSGSRGAAVDTHTHTGFLGTLSSEDAGVAGCETSAEPFRTFSPRAFDVVNFDGRCFRRASPCGRCRIRARGQEGLCQQKRHHTCKLQLAPRYFETAEGLTQVPDQDSRMQRQL